jgi:glucose/arabinose dehydrogenase
MIREYLLIAILLAAPAVPAAAADSAPTAATTATLGGDPSVGRALFRARCSLCHMAEPGDGGGGEGPSLIGVFGRHAGADPRANYSRALLAANLQWDAPTLDRFLSAPQALVPGTAMAIAVPLADERRDLIAYFASVADRTEPANQPPAPVGTADWRQDRPGRLHRIDLASLPAPFASASQNNHPKVVARPPQAELSVPPGFQVKEFASGFAGPRRMRVAANGDILLTEMTGGRVTVLRPTADGSGVASRSVFAAGLKQPYGLALYPDAKNPQWLYVAETNRIVRYAYSTGDRVARAPPEIVIASLPEGGGHVTRDIIFSPDATRFYVSVGSASNVAEQMPKKSLAEAKQWEASRSLGAAWGAETDRADVLVFSAEQPTAPAIYATGLRNCVSLSWQPGTGNLWCTVNERDRLGDDLVPDYSTRIEQGLFYGWPWYYLGSHEDPRLSGDRPDLRDHVTVPDVPYQAHSAALDLEFYVASTGCSAFPAEYVGDAFAAFHGSWNRGFRTGHKLVRVRIKDGKARGDYEDFLTGFIIDDDKVWGRPVALVELADGSLLMSEDGSGFIYRISYGSSAAAKGCDARRGRG